MPLRSVTSRSGLTCLARPLRFEGEPCSSSRKSGKGSRTPSLKSAVGRTDTSDALGRIGQLKGGVGIDTRGGGFYKVHATASLYV